MTGSSSSWSRSVAPGRLVGTVRPPASKSLTQRYFGLALFGERTLVENPLRADDTDRFLAALAVLGMGVEAVSGGIRLTAHRPPARATIDCGDNGTMLRLLTALLTAVPGEWTLRGSERLSERPLGPLVACLRSLGARVAFLGGEGHAPLVVEGGSLEGGNGTLDASLSSQFLSAVLLAAPAAGRETELLVTGLTSAPYVELTLQAMEEAGLQVERSGVVFRLRPGRPRPDLHLVVEPDLSAACYPAAAAALTAGRVELPGVVASSRQGDRRLFEVLEAMGATVEWRPDRLVVAGPEVLRAVSGDLSDIPDQVPTLAALAPFARGVTRITGVGHLRIKESDRLAAMALELSRLGAPVAEAPDGLEIEGIWATEAPPTDPQVVDSHGDHRVAMSLALVGLRRPGVQVGSPEVVAKSYPGFWEDLEGGLRR